MQDTLAGSYGYSTEVHEVDSEGYLLTLFRWDSSTSGLLRLSNTRNASPCRCCDW